jgi:hypothetical protein
LRKRVAEVLFFFFFDLSEFSENDIPSSPNIIEMRFSKKKKGRDE